MCNTRCVCVYPCNLFWVSLRLYICAGRECLSLCVSMPGTNYVVLSMYGTFGV